jgi:hypothetical protein
VTQFRNALELAVDGRSVELNGIGSQLTTIFLQLHAVSNELAQHNLDCMTMGPHLVVGYTVVFSGERMNDAIRTVDVRRARCVGTVAVVDNPRDLHDPLVREFFPRTASLVTEAAGAPDVDGIAQPVVRLDVHDQEGITDEGGAQVRLYGGKVSVEGHHLRSSVEIAGL